MANPIIQSAQPGGAGTGTAGQGRNDLQTTFAVNLSDTEAANSGATYAWVFLDKPIGSSASLTGAGTATPSFTPDIAGSYWVQATVTGSATGTSNEVLAVPLANTGARIPAFGEETEYDAAGNAKGWHEAMDDFMRSVDAMISGGGGTIGKTPIPELWTQNDVPASQAATAIFAQSSQLFDDFQVTRAGSITGISLRFNAVLSGGTATAQVTINGTPVTLLVMISSGSSSTQATQMAGIDTVAAGDRIGVTLTTNGTFAPVTLDAEVSLDGEFPGVIANKALLPEIWAQNQVPASQATTAMSGQSSQLYDDFQMARGGSITGINLRFNGALTAGTATARVTKNGTAGTLLVTISSGGTSGRSTQLSGIDSFSAGDRLGIKLETNGAFAPLTLDVEASLEVEL